MKETRQHDIVIIGGGIAGLTAAIYTCRAGLKTKVLEKSACGGLVNWAIEIENFPSYEKIGGTELMERTRAQAEKLGAEIEEVVEVERLDIAGAVKTVETDEEIHTARAVIIATGREPMPLRAGVESERIHYCAICDGAAYKGKRLLVVGGGDCGVEESLYLVSQGIEHITLVEQEERLLASRKARDLLGKCDRVTVLTSTRVCELTASEEVESLQIENLKSGEKKQLEVDGIFVYIGQSPNTEIFRGIVDLDEAGYVPADEEMRTSVPGVFVAGDVRQKRYRQITTAASDGTIAALAATEYLRDLEGGE